MRSKAEVKVGEASDGVPKSSKLRARRLGNAQIFLPVGHESASVDPLTSCKPESHLKHTGSCVCLFSVFISHYYF